MADISAKDHADIDEWQTEMQLKPMRIYRVAKPVMAPITPATAIRCRAALPAMRATRLLPFIHCLISIRKIMGRLPGKISFYAAAATVRH